MAEQIDDNQQRCIKNAVQQFIDAQIEGQEPDIDEFVNKYPEFKHQIRQKISNIRKIPINKTSKMLQRSLHILNLVRILLKMMSS